MRAAALCWGRAVPRVQGSTASLIVPSYSILSIYTRGRRSSSLVLSRTQLWRPLQTASSLFCHSRAILPAAACTADIMPSSAESSQTRSLQASVAAAGVATAADVAAAALQRPPAVEYVLFESPEQLPQLAASIAAALNERFVGLDCEGKDLGTHAAGRFQCYNLIFSCAMAVM